SLLSHVSFALSMSCVDFQLLCSVFFFHGSGDPRDLHSFPTRRSSDLDRAEPARRRRRQPGAQPAREPARQRVEVHPRPASGAHRDRKSTRLNSSHVKISYAVFCLKKKTTKPAIELTDKEQPIANHTTT